MRYDLIIITDKVPEATEAIISPLPSPLPEGEGVNRILELIADTQIEGGEVHGLGGGVNGINIAISVVHL